MHWKRYRWAYNASRVLTWPGFIHGQVVIPAYADAGWVRVHPMTHSYCIKLKLPVIHRRPNEDAGPDRRDLVMRPGHATPLCHSIDRALQLVVTISLVQAITALTYPS